MYLTLRIVLSKIILKSSVLGESPRPMFLFITISLGKIFWFVTYILLSVYKPCTVCLSSVKHVQHKSAVYYQMLSFCQESIINYPGILNSMNFSVIYSTTQISPLHDGLLKSCCSSLHFKVLSFYVMIFVM